MPAKDRIVVVGASAAGLTTAEALRREGFTGTLTMVGEELRPPYDRPPLSKQVLAGEREPETTVLRQDADLRRLALDLRLSCRATGLDPAARTVTLADGDRLRYDGLVIATGLRPRRLPFGHDLAGVHVLRTLDDALTLRTQLLSGPRVVVIGAGFLGSETAATARGSAWTSRSSMSRPPRWPRKSAPGQAGWWPVCTGTTESGCAWDAGSAA